MTSIVWPGAEEIWLPERIKTRDPDQSRQGRPPRGIVVHSGDKFDRVAESAIEDGRDISYHVAHSRKHNCLVQQVPLNRRAWHAGAEGNDWIGIALAGPYDLNPRPDSERQDFRLAVAQIIDALKVVGVRLEAWCRHQDFCAIKKDPGPGFDATWMDGFELRWVRWPY